MILGCQKISPKSGKLKTVPYRYIRCSSRSNGMPCDNHSQLNLNELEVSFFCDYLDKSPSDSFDKTRTVEIEKLNSEISENNIKLNSNEHRLTVLIKMAGILPENDILKECESIKKEKLVLTTRIDQLNSQKSSFSNHRKNKVPFITETDFDGTDSKTRVLKYADYTKSEIVENLANNNLRIQIRDELPNIIGKIYINTDDKCYKVFNRSNQMVFESEPIDNDRIWEKVKIASHEPNHTLMIKNMTPKQITEYYAKMANEFRHQERLQNKKRKDGMKPK